MSAINNPVEWLSIGILVAALVWAVMRPRGLPEAVFAVPGALLVLATGALGVDAARDEVATLGPTVGFLAAILVLAHLCDREGLFAAAGQLMARQSHGSPKRLLSLVFVVASVTTAVLSLDATVVLLTPVVFATASRLGMRPKPHVYATAHLANSASLLLPVSNLTNLLAMKAAGISFGEFAAVMALPWLFALAVEYGVFRWYFAGELALNPDDDAAASSGEPSPLPRFACGVVLATLAGFVVSSPLHIEAMWPAVAGASVLLVKRLISAREARWRQLASAAQSANIWFLVFVLALGVIVRAVVDNGLSETMSAAIPQNTHLGSMIMIATIAALLANVVNNLPAVLMLLPLVSGAGTVAVLAVLIGVNIGPNLTYVGSLATLLWRRIMNEHDEDTQIAEFTKLGLATVPLSLVGCTCALWLSMQVMGL